MGMRADQIREKILCGGVIRQTNTHYRRRRCYEILEPNGNDFPDNFCGDTFDAATDGLPLEKFSAKLFGGWIGVYLVHGDWAKNMMLGQVEFIRQQRET